MWQYNYSPSNNNRYLSHAGGFGKNYKYVRKYKGKNGKWVYVYKDKKNNSTAKIHDTNKLLYESERISGGYNDKGQLVDGSRDYYRSKSTRALNKLKKNIKNFKNSKIKSVTEEKKMKKGSAKTKKAIQKAFRSANHDDKRQRAGLAKSSKLTKNKAKTSKKKKSIISSKTSIKSYTIGSKSGAKKKKK